MLQFATILCLIRAHGSIFLQEAAQTVVLTSTSYRTHTQQGINMIVHVVVTMVAIHGWQDLGT